MSGLHDDGVYDDDELAAIERAGAGPRKRPATSGVAGWRRSSVSGSLAAAVLLGLRDALEPRAEGPAVVVDHDGDGDDRGPVTVRLDRWSPAASVAVVRDR